MKYWIALTTLVVFLAGCGGSSTREKNLEQEVADLKKEVADLEEELEDSPTQADVDQARSEGRTNAEKERDDARDERDKANEEKEKLEEIVGETTAQINRARTLGVFNGLENLTSSSVTLLGASAVGEDGTDPTINPVYGSVPKPVTTNPVVTWSEPTKTSSGRWLVSEFTSDTSDDRYKIIVFSDVERPTTVPFKDSDYNDIAEDGLTVVELDSTTTSAERVVDGAGKIVGRILVASTTQRDDVTGSNFPRDSSGIPRTYKLEDRGRYTFEQRDGNSPPTRETADGSWRNENLHPLRWNAEVSGALGGANGKFYCSAGDVTDTTTSATCTVQRVGDNLLFGGTDSTWTFVPSSASAGVRVADEQFMYFGYWSEQPNPIADEWRFRLFHGPTTGNRVTATDISSITTGTFTYRGPAAGYFAISELHGSTYDEFTARATLTANFAADTISGMIDQISGQDGWTVRLNQASFATDPSAVENDTGGTTWTIDGTPGADAGEWSGSFYSNLPSTDRNNVVPAGFAGQFQAEHGDDARMIGAFGAHKQ